MEPQQESSKGMLVGIIVFILVVALGFGIYYLLTGREPERTDGGSSVNPPPPPVSVAEPNRLSVSDQFPGQLVYVASVTLQSPGFVVIHKIVTGTPGEIFGHSAYGAGEIIGSAYFRSGSRPGQVELRSRTQEGVRYVAMLHSDDGDGRFDAAKDLPIKNSRGGIIMVEFTATKDLPEVKG